MIKRLFLLVCFLLAAAPAAQANRVANRADGTIFEADFELSLEGSTVGGVLNATFLNANTTKSSAFTGTWSTSTQAGSPTLTHTKFTADFYPFANRITIGGVLQANSGSRGWGVELTGRNGNDAGWEKIRFDLDGPGQAALAGQDYVIGMVGYFNAADTPDPAPGNQATAMDWFESNAGSFNVFQYYNEIGSSNVGNFHTHSPLENGPIVPNTRDVRYALYQRVMMTTSPQRLEGWVINDSTKKLVGYSQSLTSNTGLTMFEFKDYIAAYGGEFKLSRVRAAYGVRAKVLQDFTIDIPTWSSASQTAASAITIDWDGVVNCLSQVDYRVNGGSWTGLLTDHATTSYIHTGLVDGSTYEYRVRTTAAEYSSAHSVTSSPTTINNSTFLLDRSEAWGDGNAFPVPGSPPVYSEWNNSVGNSADMYVLFSKALGAGGGFSVASYKTSVATFGQKQKTGAIYTTDHATLFGGPMVRIKADASAAEGYGAFIQNNPGLGHYTLRIFKVTDSGSDAVPAQLGADLHGTEITWAHGDEIEIQAENSGGDVILTAFRNGTQIGTTRTDAAGSSPYLSGQPGIGVDYGSYLGAVRMREVP
jgi:hypothetical protein